MGKIALDILYPVRCPGCDEVLPFKYREKGFCKKCKTKIIRNNKATCFKCGKPITDETKEFCTDCGKIRRRFTQGKAVYVYKGPMKTAMYRFKYSNRRCYARQFAKDCMEIHGKWIENQKFDCIMPVPMYRRKQRKRGYNQAEAFGAYLSKACGVPMDKNSLMRIKNTQPMKFLSDVGRRQNLENAFKVRQNIVTYNKVLIIDDIFTTGSTMDGVAKVLLQAGVKEVYCISVCIGDAY